jgi:hypothetical protein
MQRWKKGPWLDVERAAAHLPDPVRDADTVARLELQRLEDEQIERALHQFRLPGHGSILPLFEFDIEFLY